MQEKTCEKKIYIQKVTPPKPLIPLWGVRVFGGSQDLYPYPYPPYPRVKPLINTIRDATHLVPPSTTTSAAATAAAVADGGGGVT